MPSVFDVSRGWWTPDPDEDDLADFPLISNALLTALEKRISPPRPTPTSTTGEDKYHAGAWSVVELLRHVAEEQSEETRVRRQS